MFTDKKKWTNFKPIDIVLSFHNAFRRDLLEIDEAILSVTRNGGDFAPILNRLNTTGEILDYHARGEEKAVFPVVDKVAPLLSDAYITDHRELDAMVAELELMQSISDPLLAIRASAVLKSHLKIHLYKEDTYLYPLLREHTSVDEQESIIGRLAKETPPEKTPTLVKWLFPLLGHDDRVKVTIGWMNLMPPQVFSGLKSLIQKILGEDWGELTHRIPELS